MFLNSTFRKIFSCLQMCLLDEILCIGLVVVLVITFLNSTIAMYEANRVLVHNDSTMSFTFQTLCTENYHEYCLKGGDCYVVSMKDEEGALACMCSFFYGGARCEKYMWWT